MKKNYSCFLACTSLPLLFLMACNNIPVQKEKNIIVHEDTNKPAAQKAPADQTSKSTEACDPGLWKYVYNPERLQVLDKCKTVTGTIVERSADEDGDEHMLLKLDPGQDDLLRERNMKKKGGNLVIEAVCINNITRKKVGDACVGYVNHVELPVVNDHVRVSGSLVVDSNNDNGWTEIHPITRIEIIK